MEQNNPAPVPEGSGPSRRPSGTKQPGGAAPATPSTPPSLLGLHPGDARHSILAIKRSSGRSTEIRLVQKELDDAQAALSSPLAAKSEHKPLYISEDDDDGSDQSITELLASNKERKMAAMNSGGKGRKSGQADNGQKDCGPQFTNVNRRLFRASDFLMEASPSEPSAGPAVTAPPDRRQTPEAKDGTDPPLAEADAPRSDEGGLDNGDNTSEIRPDEGQADQQVPESLTLFPDERFDSPHPDSPGPSSGAATPPTFVSSLESLFPSIPLCFDEGVPTGRVWCPINMRGEADPHWKECPRNWKHPDIPGEGTCCPWDPDLYTPDASIPAEVQQNIAEQARQGTLFAHTMANLAWATAVVDNCGYDVEAEAARLRVPRRVREAWERGEPAFGPPARPDPFLGARLPAELERLSDVISNGSGGVQNAEGDRGGGGHNETGRSAMLWPPGRRPLDRGVHVPPVMPSTIWNGTKFDRNVGSGTGNTTPALMISREWREALTPVGGSGDESTGSQMECGGHRLGEEESVDEELGAKGN